MWKSMMEDFLTIKYLSDTLEMNKKAIAYIRQWIDPSSHHHVANETNVYNLWKKLELVFEQKIVGNKSFLLKKLMNMKLKE